MHWRAKALLGVALLVAGSLFALLEVGVLLIADCSEACVARGERAVVLALIAAGVAVAALGALLLTRALRARGGAR